MTTPEFCLEVVDNDQDIDFEPTGGATAENIIITDNQIDRSFDFPRRACWCSPWCGLPACNTCGEDHAGVEWGSQRYCRDCYLDVLMGDMP